MKIKIIKKINQQQKKNKIESWKKKYGSMSSLQHKVGLSKCSSPEDVNTYITWKYLASGAEMEETVTFENADIFDVFSLKRGEILEFLANNEVSSIRELAIKLKRNYKNVYDDLKALSTYELVELREVGRALKPCSSASAVEVMLEE
jgi:predicted transcriptional regulator